MKKTTKSHKIENFYDVDWKNIEFLLANSDNKIYKKQLIGILNSIEIKDNYEFVGNMINLFSKSKGKISDIILSKISNNGEIRWDYYIDNFDRLTSEIPESINPVFGGIFILNKNNSVKFIESKGIEKAKKIHTYVHSKEFMSTVSPVYMDYINMYWPSDYYKTKNLL